MIGKNKMNYNKSKMMMMMMMLMQKMDKMKIKWIQSNRTRMSNLSLKKKNWRRNKKKTWKLIIRNRMNKKIILILIRKKK